MKIVITESQLNELKGQYKDEVEIIYRDKNILCMIPKSQMTSFIYGNKAYWCQRTASGFDNWSKMGLLVRFLFKDGRKIRFTKYFKDKDVKTDHDFYWANENGYHVLERKGDNPFEIKMEPGKRVKMTEQDILNRIRMIPEACKLKVLEFIEKHNEAYDYCTTVDEYLPKPIENKYKEFLKVYDEYTGVIHGLPHDKFIRINFDKADKMYVITYSDQYGILNNYLTHSEQFKTIDEFKSRLIELIKEFSATS